ncbi:hypothetical protein VPHD480_0126 [Vibrio phage D480]
MVRKRERSIMNELKQLTQEARIQFDQYGMIHTELTSDLIDAIENVCATAPIIRSVRQTIESFGAVTATVVREVIELSEEITSDSRSVRYFESERIAMAYAEIVEGLTPVVTVAEVVQSEENDKFFIRLNVYGTISDVLKSSDLMKTVEVI